MSNIEITLHGMKETKDGSVMCDQSEATSWSVFVREYMPNDDIEMYEDEDFDTKVEALVRLGELMSKYPGADFEELE